MHKKQQRRTRAQLRELMLTAGTEVLLALTPSMGFEQLTYSQVFDHLATNHNQRVTIGSVHERIWPSQRDYQLEVLAKAINDTVIPTADFARERALQAIAALDLDTPQSRRDAVRTAVRMNSHSLFSEPEEDAVKLVHVVRFHLWAVGMDHPEAAGFTDALLAIRQTSTKAFADVARAITQAVGLRVRATAGNPAEVFESLAILGNASFLGLRTDVLPAASQARQLPTGPDGSLEDWYPDALALWAFTTLMFELDGDGLTSDERRL